MKRIILAILFLIFLIRLPLLPYKNPEDKPSTKNNEVRLVVKDGQNTGGLYVSEGTEYTKEYLYSNNIENIPYDEISLSGNTMYNEVALFKNGIPTPPFVVYGDFSPGVVNVAGEGHTYNLLTLKVDRWYPEKGSIELWDTYLWEKIYLDKIVPFLIIVTLIYVFFTVTKLSISKLSRQDEKRKVLNSNNRGKEIGLKFIKIIFSQLLIFVYFCLIVIFAVNIVIWNSVKVKLLISLLNFILLPVLYIYTSVKIIKISSKVNSINLIIFILTSPVYLKVLKIINRYFYLDTLGSSSYKFSAIYWIGTIITIIICIVTTILLSKKSNKRNMGIIQ